MPVQNWTTTVIDGKNFLVIDVAKLRIPLDWTPDSNVFIAVAAPTGGVMNYPALVKGDNGDTPNLDTVVAFTALAYDDATPPSAELEETGPNTYKLHLALRNGAPGAPGNTVLDPSDFDTPLPGKILALNSDASAFILQTPKVGDEYWPTAINNTPSGNPAYTLCSVGVGVKNFDWRPEVSGWCKVAGTGADVAVNLHCRLDDEAGGNIVGMAYGEPGVNPPVHTIVTGPPTNSVDTYNKVLAGNAATIYLRAERRTGTDTFTTSNTTTRFRVKVQPVP